MGIFDTIGSMFGTAKLEHSEAPPKGEIATSDIFGSGAFPLTKGMTVYNPSLLVGRKGLSIFTEMRCDEQVKAAMAFKQGTVVATGWEIQSPEGKPENWEMTTFVQEQLNKLGTPSHDGGHRSRGDLSEKIIEILSSMEYGFSVTEKIWRETDSGVELFDIKTRAPYDFDFKMDSYGNLLGLEQDNRDLPINKFIIHTYDSEFQNPYGKSDLEAVYRPWWIKSNAFRWLSMLLEKHGVPPIFALYNPEDYKLRERNDLKSALKNIQAATVGIIPKPDKDSIEMWTPELADNVQNVFLPAIDKFDNQISKGILMPGLLGLTSDESQGSFARSQTHFDVFMLIIQRVRKDLEAVVNNEIVHEIVSYNFGEVEEMPVFKFKPLNSELKEGILETWQKLVEGKVVTPQPEDEKHIRNAVEFPPMSEETLKRNEPEPEPDNTEDDETEDNDMLDDEEVNRELAAYLSLNRQPNQYERKVDFAQVAKDMNEREAEAVGMLVDIMKGVREATINNVRKSFKPNVGWVSKYSLRGMAKFESGLFEVMNGNFKIGAERVREEIPRALSTHNYSERGPSFVPKEALAYLKAQAIQSKAIIGERLLTQIKQAMLNGIKNGQGAEDIIVEIEKTFVPYTGDDQVLRDGKIPGKHRLETIVRTTSTEAFNQGRLVQMRSPEARRVVSAVQYSAIIDDRTTEVCQGLDQKIFRVTTDDLSSLTPPNHYNCRSVLVPITIDEPVEESQVIDQTEVGRAKQRAGEGFT